MIKRQKVGPTEIRTRVVGFKVQSDSHYTIGPSDNSRTNVIAFKALCIGQRHKCHDKHSSAILKFYLDQNFQQLTNHFCKHLFISTPKIKT